MNRDIGRQWVADLRDGTRTQGRGVLRGASGAQCCLDVLCEQAVRAGVIDAPKQLRPTGPYMYDTPSGSEMHSLPPEVTRWAGLDDHGSAVTVYYDSRQHHTDLAVLNDDEQLSFDEIAYVIEKELIGDDDE